VSAHSPSAFRAGGAGLFASWALKRLGARVILHTPLAGKDRDLLEWLPPGVETIVHPSRETTTFRIEVDPDDVNKRTLLLLAAGDSLDPERLERAEKPAYVLLGPLLPADLDDSLVAVLERLDTPIDLGAQGLVRQPEPSGRITPCAVEGGINLPPLRVLAGDDSEIARLAGSSETEEALEILSHRTAGEVIATHGDRGASIRLRGGAPTLRIQAVPPRGPAAHPIGLGDTFLATYGWCRHTGAGPAEAGARAAVAATELLVAGLPVPPSR
jgi:sugar/nucleoside kinase (ribokinase family)